jgi:hypothetical protein
MRSLDESQQSVTMVVGDDCTLEHCDCWDEHDFAELSNKSHQAI